MTSTQKPKASRHAPEEVDAYLSQLPKPERDVLERLREMIRGFAPKVTERVSYQVPIFRLEKDFIGIAAHQKHCAIYTMSHAIIKAIEPDLAGQKCSGTTLQFTLEHPISDQLFLKILSMRLAELEARAAK